MNEIPECLGQVVRTLSFLAASAAALLLCPVQFLDHCVLPRGNARMRSRRGAPAKLFLLIFFLLLAGGFAVRAGDGGPSEAQVKAAFLLNFPKYVDWPPAAFAAPTTPLVFGILGDKDVAAEFSVMSRGKIIDGHPIKFLPVTSAEQCRGCHVLFVGTEADRKFPEILSQLHGHCTLTVGETEDFIEEGGIINLARRDRRIALEVNIDAARQTELKISSKLLALATVKGEKK